MFVVLLMLVLISGVFAPVQAASENPGPGNDHIMGAGHDEDESYGMQGMAAASSAGVLQSTLPVIYGLFAVVVILVLVILYIVFIRQRDKGKKDSEITTGRTEENNSDIVEDIPVSFPSGLKTKYSDAVLIGRGGLSAVYSARSIETGETVAVKIPSGRDEKSGGIFLQEIKIWEGLSHPNIVSLRSVNVFPVPYAEMEYIPDSLESLELPLEADTAVNIAAGVLRGLSYAHKKGIVHCDIKPANILIDDEFIPKITDWGVGRHLTADNRTEFHGYTPAFAAPEQVSPEFSGCTERTDIFQTGMLILRMLCGRTVFGRNFGKEPEEYLHECIKDERLRGIVTKCIQKDPDKRYGSADELLSEILSLSGHTVTD